jgi:hypothetical protein
MSRLRRPFLSLLVPIFLLGALVVSAEAAQTRHIRATGTSTGSGVCTIIIESFGLLKDGGPQIEAPQVFNIPVAIPSSSSPSNSATLIRNDVDAALPADYVVTVVFGHPDLVRIERTVGTFTMSVTEDVDGQVIEEAVVYVPALGSGELVLLAMLLTLAGAWLLRKRARSET